MTERFLQITYRRGRVFADYLYLPGATGEKSATHAEYPGQDGLPKLRRLGAGRG